MGKPTFLFNSSSTSLEPAVTFFQRALDRHATPGASPGRARSRAVAAPRRLRCDPVLPGQPKTIRKLSENRYLTNKNGGFSWKKMGIDSGLTTGFHFNMKSEFLSSLWKNAGFGYQHVDFTMQNGDLGIWELTVGETIKTGTKLMNSQ
jgi:hypothetical protein